jgi:hypothetical protein
MLWTVAKEAAGNWSSHKDSRQGAALAYYSVFSLGPIIVIAIAVAGFFFGRDAVSGQVASSTKDSGRRVYDTTDLRMLVFIRRSCELGFSLDEIRALLRLGGPE